MKSLALKVTLIALSLLTVSGASVAFAEHHEEGHAPAAATQTVEATPSKEAEAEAAKPESEATPAAEATAAAH